jgi:hypothetical protein
VPRRHASNSRPRCINPARGNERRALFRNDRDREKYVSRIACYRERLRLPPLLPAFHLGQMRNGV